MSSGQSMDASVLMQKLLENEINALLLIEFYEEVVENEKVFCDMVAGISKPQETEERRRSVDHIERFCFMLKEMQSDYDYLLGKELMFATETAKRENMIDNASRFIEMLEKDCNLSFPR